MKQKIIKHLLLIFIILLGAFSVASCGGTKGNDDEGDGGDNSNNVTYTLTFETVGGSLIDPVQVEKGKTVTRPEDLIKDGTDFIDWYLSSTYEGEPYNFNSPVNSDLTLYAKWADGDYAVVFDIDGGYPLIEYGNYAFYGISTLEKLTVKGSILGKGTFQQSDSLKEVNFVSENPYETGEQTFWQDTALEKVTFSEGLTKIGNNAFCLASLSKITIPSSVESIGDYAFYDNHKLDQNGENIRTFKQINFNEGLVSVGEKAFSYAQVEELYLPSTLVIYGEYAFYLCEKLKTVVFADGSTVIGGKGAFQAKALEKVVFADNCIIKELKDYCFGNTNL